MLSLSETSSISMALFGAHAAFLGAESLVEFGLQLTENASQPNKPMAKQAAVAMP